MVWTLLAAGESRLGRGGAVLRPVPRRRRLRRGLEGGRARHLRRARRAGERDASRRGAALATAGLTHQIVTFPGADHAFFNDTGPRYNRTAAEAAYKRVLAWFARYVR